MNDQKTTNTVPAMLFADECFPDISTAKTKEENRAAIEESFEKIRRQIDKEIKKETLE